MEDAQASGLAADALYGVVGLMKRAGPPTPWIGFNYTEQDMELHLVERMSIPATYAISSIFPTLAIIAVILRFVAAGRSKAGRTADDWIILAALLPTIASCVWMIATYVIDKDRIVKSFFKEAEKGNFTELDDPLGNANALQWGPGVVSTFYLTALTLIKLSILLLYRRLFDTPIMHRIVQGGMVSVVAVWITFVVPSLLGLANDKGLSNGTIFVFILVFGCIHLITDICLLILPVSFVWSLHMTRARRLQIIGMFSLGAFCVVSSTVRLAFLADYWVKLQYVMAHESDWYAAFTIAQFARSWWMTWIWALIEPCTSIIAACLPCLRPLVDGLDERHPRLAKTLGVVYPGSSVNARSTGENSVKYAQPNQFMDAESQVSSVHKNWATVSVSGESTVESIGSSKITTFTATAMPIRSIQGGDAGKIVVQQRVHILSSPVIHEEGTSGPLAMRADPYSRPARSTSDKSFTRTTHTGLRKPGQLGSPREMDFSRAVPTLVRTAHRGAERF